MKEVNIFLFCFFFQCVVTQVSFRDVSSGQPTTLTFVPTTSNITEARVQQILRIFVPLHTANVTVNVVVYVLLFLCLYGCRITCNSPYTMIAARGITCHDTLGIDYPINSIVPCLNYYETTEMPLIVSSSVSTAGETMRDIAFERFWYIGIRKDPTDFSNTCSFQTTITVSSVAFYLCRFVIKQRLISCLHQSDSYMSNRSDLYPCYFIHCHMCHSDTITSA